MKQDITKTWQGGIIHVPLDHSEGNEHIQQMFHNQPILSGPGMDVVRSKEHKEYCSQNTLLDALNYMAKHNVRSIPLVKESDIRQLYNDGFRLIYIDTRKSKSKRDAYLKLLKTDVYKLSGSYIAIPLSIE